MRKSYKYRIYPNSEQTQRLLWTLDRCREVYNACLDERKSRYEIAVRRNPRYHDPVWRKQAAREHAISLYDQQNQLAPMKQERPEYRELSAAHLLNDVCKRVDLAFAGFFRRVQHGQTPGYPRFQGRNRYDSFCYPDASGWKLHSEQKKLTLTRIGDIRIKLHRPVEGTVKTCTIKREGDHWYAVFSCEVPDGEPLPKTEEEVGIDLGITHFAALSNGEFIDNPRYYRKAERALVRHQQALARKKRGSHRRKRAARLVARTHRKIRNQRRDFLHKQSRRLVNRYQLIVFEDLQTANLVKRPQPVQDEQTGAYQPNGAAAKGGLNKSISDAGWSEFVQLCSYKAAWADRTLIQVRPNYTSQVCSGCGQVRKKDLAERWHSCECGAELDRDHNAAINILTLGRHQISEAHRPAQPTQCASQTTNGRGPRPRQGRRGTFPPVPPSNGFVALPASQMPLPW